MGIKGLTKFLADQAPSALQMEARASLLGRVVAVDASMALYQFLTAVRDAQTMGNLTDESGNVTSHLAGMLARVTRMLEQGIRPVYVFDGAAPEQKAAELDRRRERREEAVALAEAAKEAGDTAELRKQLARTIRVSPEQNAEVQRLLQLLGLPVVKAPGEAEAQCAALAKSGKVWASATEDADALTFGTPILIRNLTFSDSSTSSSSSGAGSGTGVKGHPVLSIRLDKVLSQLQLTMDQFIDFCILCGCDYCGSIRGVGAKTAYNMIKQHGNIEGVLEALDKEKYTVPDPFPFQAARECFKQPLVLPPEEISLKWGDVDEQGLKQFLVQERTFSEARVEGYLQRLRKAKGLSTQTRLENFFGSTVSKASDLAVKQKTEQANSKNAQKKRSGHFKGPPAKRR
ncbi:flap endonuclease [Cyclospora cayetanensis]|uniref:Flap endonuclease 1 n=1 Tax=Cyclospora cayetanensis TaxID=88456 RepID=A0A1D3D692_9EIME|nr:flap endonuclease [Cyclospora cayetanensis]